MKRAVFAYIPVVHKQVLELLERYKGASIWVLDNEVGKKDNVFLERDARALPAHHVKIALTAHGFKDVVVVAPQEVAALVDTVDELVVPEDEIIIDLLEGVSQKKIKKENIFIRWTQLLSTQEQVVPAHRTITTLQFHNEIFKKLSEEVVKSPDWWRQIAAAIVVGGDVVAIGHNKHFPSPHALSIHGDPRSNFNAGEQQGIYTSIHAEAAVIAEMARKGSATAGADMYVTTFPCPTCARLLVVSGIKRLFYKKGYSLLDAEEILSGAGVEIVLVQEGS